GGSGYTREYPVEQCWRDNRLNPIHEGTNGIQALDLLTRKLWQANGAGLALLQGRMQQDFEAVTGQVSKQLIAKLQPYLQKMQGLIPGLGASLQSEQQAVLLANATCFMNIFGQIVMSWMWIRQANIAEVSLATLADSKEENQQDVDFYNGKIQAAKYFVHWELPLVQRDITLLIDMDDSCSDMQADWF
ncbi:MAG: acyl-CoA dehydrogenase, partial [Paraglaciecola sp.]